MRYPTLAIGGALMAVLLASAATAPATANTATTPSGCAGAIGTPVKVYDFTGTGSAALQETIGHQAADALHIVPGHPGVTFTGAAAVFDGNGLLQLNASNFNPGTRSFSVCVYWAWVTPKDTDGYNLLNLGDNPGTGNAKGFVKIMPGYGRIDSVGGAYAQELSHGSSQVINHVEHVDYNAATDTVCTWLDGVQDDCGPLANANVDLSLQPLAVGGKFERSPGSVGTSDLGKWKIYRVVLAQS